MQYIEEPLYKLQISEPITATEMLSGEEIPISANKFIYVFYSIVNNKLP
jgi:hypothetical protein